MKKLFLLLVPCMAFAATEPINVNTADGHVKETSSGVGDPTKPFDFSDVTVTGLPGGGGGVSTFSAGNLSPLFTTSVANPTTAPALSFTLSTAAAHTFFGNETGSTAAPHFVQPAFTDLSGSFTLAQSPSTTASKLIGRGDSGAGIFQEIGMGDNMSITGTSLKMVPTGSSTQILYNNSGIVTGISTFTFDGSSVVTQADTRFQLADVAEPTAKAYFDLTNITAGQTRLITIADSSSVTVAPDAGAANNFLTAISSTGVISKAQPAFSNLSGDFALTQTPSLAADSLIGRGNGGGAGDWQAITIGSGLSMTGTTLSVTAGGGNVSNTGTPTDGQLSQWATSTTIRGVTPTSPIVSTGGGTPSITLDVGVDHAFTAAQSVSLNDGEVSTFSDLLTLRHNSTGTVLADFGASFRTELEDASGTTQFAHDRIVAWSDPATSTRTSYISWRLANSGVNGHKMRLFGSGGLSVNSTTDPGAGQINANTGFKIANAALNFSHLAGDFALTQTPSAAADKLIGRGNGGGAGDWQEITLGTNLSMSGTTLNATGGGSQTPWTANVDADGFSLLFDDATGIKSSEAGNPELLLFTSVASAVNELTLSNAATGLAPTISATGNDSAIHIDIAPKGGSVQVKSDSTFAGHVEALRVYHNSSSAATNGFGTDIIVGGKTSTTNDKEMGGIQFEWTDATHATRSSSMFLATVLSGVFHPRAAIFASGGFAVRDDDTFTASEDPGGGFISANNGFKVGTTALNFSHLAGDFALTQTPSAAASKLIGRGDSGAGDWQEITVGGGLAMTGTTLSATAGGATFLALTDTPSSYSGQALKAVRVNAGETALEFATAGGSQTPWTSNIDADGFSLLFDDATGIKSSETTNPELLLFTSAASAVNELTLSNAPTGSNPTISATGDDSTIEVALVGKHASVTTTARVGFDSTQHGLQIVNNNTNGTVLTLQNTSAGGVRWDFNSQGSGNGQPGHFAFYNGANTILDLSGTQIGTYAGGYIGWWSDATFAGSGSFDTALYRNAAGVVEINNGTAGQYRDLKARNLDASNAATGAGVVRIFEDTDDGAHKATFTVPALAADTAYILPPDDGDAGEQLQTNGSGTLTWEPAGSGAPADADYLVGTANGTLSAEIVVGTSPGGELGGSWASPTIDDSVAVTSWNLTTPTLTGAATLAESASIHLDEALTTGNWSGITITGVSGFAQTYGDLVYLDDTTSRWEECDANAAAAADGDSRRMLGIVVVTGTDGNACTILLQGTVRADTQFPTFTAGAPLYVSETAGEVTQTQPTTADVVIRVVGYGLAQADTMYFNPSGTWTTHL